MHGVKMVADMTSRLFSVKIMRLASCVTSKCWVKTIFLVNYIYYDGIRFNVTIYDTKHEIKIYDVVMNKSTIFKLGSARRAIYDTALEKILRVAYVIQICLVRPCEEIME